jgi:hypothetical protein
MRLFGDMLTPQEEFFYHLGRHLFTILGVVALIAAATVVLIVLLKQKKRK